MASRLAAAGAYARADGGAGLRGGDADRVCAGRARAGGALRWARAGGDHGERGASVCPVAEVIGRDARVARGPPTA